MDDSLKDSWIVKGPISKTIKDRIKKAGKRFHCNDNISEYIEDGDLEKLQAEVQEELDVPDKSIAELLEKQEDDTQDE